MNTQICSCTHELSLVGRGLWASAETERALKQLTLYLQAAVVSAYWSVIKSLGQPQGQFISDVIMPELYMTACVNHKCWISHLHKKWRQEKTKKKREKKHREGLWRTPAVGPVSQNKMSVGWCCFYVEAENKKDSPCSNACVQTCVQRKQTTWMQKYQSSSNIIGMRSENKVIGVDFILRLPLKMEPSAVKFQGQTLAANPNEQINGVSSEVSLLELAPFSAPVAHCGFLRLALTNIGF